MTNNMKWACLFFITICIACKAVPETVDRFAHIKDEKARAIIKASITHAGGIEKWESIRSLKYTKDFALLGSEGEIEKSFKQVHNYSYTIGDPTIYINSEENGDLIYTEYVNGKYHRTINGNPMDIDANQLKKAVNTSTYVIGMPFKLLDAGASINYEGELTMENGTLVDVIRVSYDPVKHDNHSTADVWKYYFDKTDHKIVGNWVQSSDHANIVENLTFERVGGILFNKHRKSYRLDSLGAKEYLRADYAYDNYDVSF